jgi:GAF domain-containing protein
MQAIAELFESIVQVQDLNSLLLTATDLISARFGFYHAGIFFVDNNKEYAVLQAANSEGGKRMLARRHRLRVGSEGLVGFVTGRGLAIDAIYIDNPDLPDTLSEIALPLRIAGETIGALDLQSVEPDAFSQDDIEVLSILANQLAIAIQNARSFESARQAVQDAETAYQQITEETWSQFTKSQALIGYHFDGIEAKSLAEDRKEPAGAVLQVPVRLRGREIGKLKLRPLESDRIWSDDEIAMTESIAERAALSLENARLLEVAHRRAAREHTIGAISAQISSATRMEDVLRFAVEELGRKMGGAEVIVELGTE